MTWILVRRGRRRKAAAAARLQAEADAAAEFENAESAMFDIEPVGTTFDM